MPSNEEEKPIIPDAGVGKQAADEVSSSREPEGGPQEVPASDPKEEARRRSKEDLARKRRTSHGKH